MNDPKIGVNRLVRRQTKESKFSYFNGSESELIALAKQNWPLRKLGKKEGSFIVRIPPASNNKSQFFSSVVKARPGMLFRTEYTVRHKNDEARITTTSFANKTPGRSAELILYSRSLLKEIGKQSPAEEFEYEIVSVNVSPDDTKTPPHLYDLLRAYRSNPQNFMSDFTIPEIMRAIDYWSHHAYVRSPKKQSMLDHADPEVVNQIISGNKIQAVKLYRQMTNSDLKTATIEINKLEEALAERGYFDEKPKKDPSGMGIGMPHLGSFSYKIGG